MTPGAILRDGNISCTLAISKLHPRALRKGELWCLLRDAVQWAKGPGGIPARDPPVFPERWGTAHTPLWSLRQYVATQFIMLLSSSVTYNTPQPFKLQEAAQACLSLCWLSIQYWLKRSYAKTLTSSWFPPGCLSIAKGPREICLLCTGQCYHRNWPDGRCLQFWWFRIVLPRCLKSFPDVPTFLCVITYAPSWLFWTVYYSQDILLPLHNAWTCHFYIKNSFHSYFLRKAGIHGLLWSCSHDEQRACTLNVRLERLLL